MSRLKHRTRDGSSIKFKTNVFFAAHPQEHDRFFDEVVRDFIDICDCVIWYDACPAQEYDEQLRLDLSRMRIIVIPVTRRLLTEENPVTTRLLVFALEQHIHILPILFEDVPDWMYGRYFGKRQYLSKIDQDPTLVPYGQKLKKHLESVLISGEMMERIRREFDGYIFLSYRKKDRLLANELMSLIHSYPHLRDVAIWYDEFLNPGEEFEGDIRRAMEKSKLFALLVTPNLLEEPNYVKNNEYPEARKLGMRILPAQMAPTDREQLFRDYEFLALPVDARDREALEEALNSGLSGIALKAKATSAEHEYLIGLAYLEGIDVERNVDMGLKLIKKAAEDGHLEAKKKLAETYCAAASGYKLTNDYAISKELLTLARGLYSDLHSMTKLPEYKYRYAETLFHEALVEANVEIVDLLYRCVKCELQDVLEYMKDARVSSLLAEVTYRLAELCFAEERYSECIDELQYSLNMCDTGISLSPDEAKIHYLKCQGFVLMAKAQLARNDIKTAKETGKEGKNYAQKLFTENRLIYYYRTMRDCFDVLAEVYEREKDSQKQRKCERNALKYAKKNAEYLGLVQEYYEWGRLMNKIGKRYLGVDDKNASFYYDEVEKIYMHIDMDALVKNDYECWGYLSVVRNASYSFYATGKTERAASCLRKAYLFAEQLLASDESEENCFIMAKILYDYAYVCQNIELYRKAESIFTELSNKDPSNETYREYLERIQNSALLNPKKSK